MWIPTGNSSDWDWLDKLKQSSPEIHAIIMRHGYFAINDPDAIRTFCEEVIEKNPKLVEAYKKGKKQVMGSFIGQIMARTNSGVEPEAANKIMKEILDV
jgi:aspartyl-tRNA(Asn)/glutamyl-tRNA(Gln) amidotransferase subunit B